MSDEPEPTYTMTDRGFKHYRSILTDYGHEIRVYESSAAMRPMLWLSVELTPEQAKARGGGLEPHERVSAHLSFPQAQDIIKALMTAMGNHYQLEGQEPVTDAMCERLIASFAKDAEETPGCPTPQEQINRARRAIKAVFLIPHTEGESP